MLPMTMLIEKKLSEYAVDFKLIDSFANLSDGHFIRVSKGHALEFLHLKPGVDPAKAISILEQVDTRVADSLIGNLFTPSC